MDGWVGGRMDMDMDGWLAGWMDGWVNGWMSVWMEVGWMDGCMHAWTDGDFNLFARLPKSLKKKGEYDQVPIHLVFHFQISNSKGTRSTSQPPAWPSPFRALLIEILDFVPCGNYSQVQTLNSPILRRPRYRRANQFSRDTSRKITHLFLKYFAAAKASALTWRWVHSVFILLTPTNWSKSVIQVKQPLVIGFSVLQSHIAKA